MPNLSPSELDQLRRLVGCMIPAAQEYGAPGADDPAILADIASVLQQGPAPLTPLLAEIAAGALDDPSGGEIQLNGLRQRHAAAFAAVIMALAQCYYRDDRVMRALGMEPRAPFPKGYEVTEGDWTLLDAVRDRPPIWRDA